MLRCSSGRCMHRMIRVHTAQNAMITSNSIIVRPFIMQSLLLRCIHLKYLNFDCKRFTFVSSLWRYRSNLFIFLISEGNWNGIIWLRWVKFPQYQEMRMNVWMNSIQFLTSEDCDWQIERKNERLCMVLCLLSIHSIPQ